MRLRIFLVCVVAVAAASMACSVDLGLGEEPTAVPTINYQALIVPTDTPKPLPTATPTPLPSETPTVQPTEAESSEADNVYRIRELENGSSVFIDNEVGYRLTFSPAWMIVPMDDDLIAELLSASEEALSPELAEIVEATSSDGGIRMMAFDKQMSFSANYNTITNINLVYEEEPLLKSLDLEFILALNVEALSTYFSGVVVEEQTVLTNAKGIEYGWLLISQPESTFGTEMTQMMAMVKFESGLLVITCSTAAQMYPTVEPLFKEVIDSFKMNN